MLVKARRGVNVVLATHKDKIGNEKNRARHVDKLETGGV